MNEQEMFELAQDYITSIEPAAESIFTNLSPELYFSDALNQKDWWTYVKNMTAFALGRGYAYQDIMSCWEEIIENYRE